MDFKLLRNEIIGQNTLFNSPYGKRLITYADYTASGKTLGFIEKYLIKLQEVYANTHTEDSFTGKTMTALVNKAKKNIKFYIGANNNNYLIPIGTGSTGAIAKLCEILGLYLPPGLKAYFNIIFKNNKNRYQYDIKEMYGNINKNRPIVFVGPYEHHSNYLIWKESIAKVIEIELDKFGEIDFEDLNTKLNKYRNRIKIGSFSASSNITGIKTDCYKLAKLFHLYNGLIFFDFAANAPYDEINMNIDDKSYFDAIFISPHKFIGGPGSSGLLVINKNLYSNIYAPTVAGGGTVDFVSPYFYQFTKDVETRENAGTPGILQILKSELVFEFKDLIGIKKIESIESEYIKKAFKCLENEDNLIILGPNDPKKRISILSFNIKHNDKLLHYKFVAKLLNDLFGIQSRAGCACAGPYAHKLLGIDKNTSLELEQVINEGLYSLRPGFTRINFHYLMSDTEVEFIIKAIQFIAKFGYLFLSQYKINLNNGEWHHNYLIEYNDIVDHFGIQESLKTIDKDVFNQEIKDRFKEYNKYLKEANSIATNLENVELKFQKIQVNKLEKLRWFNFCFKDDYIPFTSIPIGQ